MRLRRLRVDEDAAALRGLARALFSFRELRCFDRAWRGLDGALSLVAVDGGRVVGAFLAARDGITAITKLHYLMVAEECQGRGWGSRLLEAGCAHLWEDEGIDTVRLVPVAGNGAITAFYVRHGFAYEQGSIVKMERHLQKKALPKLYCSTLLQILLSCVMRKLRARVR